MNKTSIEWCDYTWNLITGTLHICRNCYARDISNPLHGCKAWPDGFEPKFHENRLNDPAKTKKRQTVFVSSMVDLFDIWVPNELVLALFEACHEAPQHTYIFLTNHPTGYFRIPTPLISENMWFGVTVNGYSDYSRVLHLQHLEANKFISFEPLQTIEPEVNCFEGIGQVMIGAQKNPFKEVTPEMVMPILEAAKRDGNIPVFFKNSMPEWAQLRRELAWSLNKPTEVIS
jgi:protein gp37